MSDHGTALEQAFARLKSERSRREFMRLAGLLGGGFAVAAARGDEDDQIHAVLRQLRAHGLGAVEILTPAEARERTTAAARS